MKLWVTPKGDKWLCDDCQDNFAEQIKDEKWRVAFEKHEPMLRCAECGLCDMDVLD